MESFLMEAFVDLPAAVARLERGAAQARAAGCPLATLAALIVETPDGRVTAKLVQRQQARRVYRRLGADLLVQHLDIDDPPGVLRVIAVERRETESFVVTDDFAAFARGVRKVWAS